MTDPAPLSETIHASCVAIGGRAILIGGASGSGKSDLAYRLIDRGAALVSDDYTIAAPKDGLLLADAPDTIRGRIELRGVGLLALDWVSGVPVALYVDLDGPVERLPEARTRRIAGVDLPHIALNALEASAPLKVEAALRHIGLSFR